MAGSVYIKSATSLEHDTGAHPERLERITAIEDELSARDWLGYERVDARAANREQLGRVHRGPYIDSIRDRCLQGGGSLDADTVVSEGSWQAALDSAGGAAQMVDMLLAGTASVCFCGLRPPGHHSTATSAMGFCLFNNVAVAASQALEQPGCSRVVVLDWDVHHGNGTNDIFYDSDGVLYISIHQMPLYPGSGAMQSHGSGQGKGYTVNLPVPPGSGEAEYLSLFAHVIEPIARSYTPDLILVSAGYDAHIDDPLANIELTDASYAAMTSRVRRLSEEMEAPLGFVLEGGYNLDALAGSVAATMASAVAGTADSEAKREVGRTPLADRAAEYFAQWWR